VLAEVYVSTEDPELEKEALTNGAIVIRRPTELATDLSPSEASISHAIETSLSEFEVLVFVQPTSPFIDGADVLKAIERIETSQADSVFSAVEDHSFKWIQDEKTLAWMPKHHDKRIRPRRQELPPQVRETGAFYAFRVSKYQFEQTRFCGVSMPQIVDSTFSQEIDTYKDLAWARLVEPGWEANRDVAISPTSDFLRISALAYDFDGVMTPNTAILDENGKESVLVSRSDGLGIRLLKEAGFPQTIISLELNPVVAMRANKLGIPATQGVLDKPAALANWATGIGVDLSQVAFVGNDINDLEAMASVGFPIAVADAHPKVRAAARFVLGSIGGDGAIRELADIVLTRKKER
jgi:N-acylneuraminate cytidylyltransferase